VKFWSSSLVNRTNRDENPTTRVPDASTMDDHLPSEGDIDP
jgi:hypothetical protein